MKEMIIVALVIIGVIVSAIYTYLFQQVYTERYGRRGLSYVLAAILAAGIMWFSLEFEVPSGWEYKVSLAIIIVSALLNLIWIIRGLLKPDVPVGMKINAAVSQILLVIGIAGIIFIALLALYAFGGGDKRRKR